MEFSLKDKKTLTWLAVAFVFKLALFAVYAFFFNANWPAGEVVKGIAVNTADTPDYYQPIEKLVQGEGYSLNIMKEGYPPETAVVPWAYRMPGLLPVYLPLYALFGGEWGRFFIILLQFAAELVSIVLLAKTAALLFKTRKIFFICFVLYVLNVFASVYTFYSTSESFCISFFIFSTYFLVKFFQTLSRKDLFLAGLFLCWALFLRPVIVIFIPVYFILVVYHSAKTKTAFLKTAVVNVAVLFSVLLVAESIWITRNYKTFHRFIPLNDSFEAVATKQELALYKLIITWGGDIQNWNPSEGRWFIRPTDSKTRVYDAEFQETNPFPASIFTPDYSLDSLKTLRSLYWKTFDYKAENDSTDYHLALFLSKTDKYIQSFKTHQSFQYHIGAKLRHMKTFLLIKRPYGLPFNGKDMLSKAVRGLSVAFYYFILLGGLGGMLLVLFSKETMLAKIFPFGALLFIAVHCWFGYTEFRYLLPAYTILTIYASYSVLRLMALFKREKDPGLSTS